jgi:hypothetical protein
METLIIGEKTKTFCSKSGDTFFTCVESPMIPQEGLLDIPILTFTSPAGNVFMKTHQGATVRLIQLDLAVI